MTTEDARARLRRLVLATSVPPFAWAYSAWYRGAAALLVRRLRRLPFVVAIYLRGGGGRGDLLPLVSDLDFVIVVGDAPAGELRAVREIYDRVARLTRVLDRSPVVAREGQLRALSIVPRRQVWLAEARSTWRLLHGREVRGGFPELDVRQAAAGLLHEMRVWWARFAACAIADERRRRDSVALVSVAYKAVSEILGLGEALEGRPLVFGRAERLRRGAAHEDGAVRGVSARLLEAYRRRFLAEDPGLLDAAQVVLAGRLDAAGAALRRHDAGRALTGAGKVDAPLAEWITPALRRHVDRLRGAARETWGPRLRGVHLTTGAAFDLGEWALALRVDPSMPPAVNALRALHDVHAAAEVRFRRAVHPYLLLDHAALQLDPEERTKSERAVLVPSANPDVFELLARPDLALDGSPARPAAAPPWTPLASGLVGARTDVFLELLERWAPGAGGTSFVGLFRKALQLVLIERSAGRGEVLYPLTQPAVLRALATLGVELPEELTAALQPSPSGRPAAGDAAGAPTPPAEGGGPPMPPGAVRRLLEELRGPPGARR
jgi:predicted nucleotidyltransferase